MREKAMREEGREDAAVRERAMLDALAAGRTEYFWDIWQGYQAQLFRICLREMRGREDDAEDALSRAMMQAWQRLPGHAAGISSLKGWLSRLTLNVCIDIHRERSRYGDVVANVDDLEHAEGEYEWAITSSPEDLLLQYEMRCRLNESVAELSPSLRAPFILRFLHDMEYREIASALNISAVNVRKRIQQARVVLRRTIGIYLSEADEQDESRRRAQLRTGRGASQAGSAIDAKEHGLDIWNSGGNISSIPAIMFIPMRRIAPRELRYGNRFTQYEAVTS